MRLPSALALLAVGALALLVTATSAAHAQQGEDLRDAAQNPIADLISVPFQNNTNFDIGHTDNTQNVLNIQPVYPLHLNPTWNLITRPILPVIYQPPFFAGRELARQRRFSVRDWRHRVRPGRPHPRIFLFAEEAHTIWVQEQAWCGVLDQRFSFQPPQMMSLAPGKWSAGPGFVVFLSDRALHVTTGFLILNLWSFAGDEDRANVNAMTLQPFLNYNLPKGWYLTSSPLITANWEADDDNRWTVPIGGGIGRIFKIGHQPINANIAAYYNVVTPDDTGANWQLRAQWTFLFPTH